jgi:hypothetical protein
MGAFPARSRFLFRTYQSIQPKTKALGLSPLQALIYKAGKLKAGYLNLVREVSLCSLHISSIWFLGVRWLIGWLV